MDWPYILYRRFARTTEGVRASSALFGTVTKDRWDSGGCMKLLVRLFGSDTLSLTLFF